MALMFEAEFWGVPNKDIDTTTETWQGITRTTEPIWRITATTPYTYQLIYRNGVPYMTAVPTEHENPLLRVQEGL